MTEILLKQIRKSYGSVEVIHGIDLEIGSGEFVVFVGPSGCGKSTLLRIIAGLEDITDGDLMIDGEQINQVGAADRGLAMVFQSYALYPHMSVYKNMAFGLENTKMAREEIDNRVRNAAEMLQITDYLQRKPKALSGGQRQRVAIGRAIVRDPKAFLFDEPLSNLDAELRVTMRKELAALHASIGGTMIYVTHDQTEAMTLADKIVVLKSGAVMQVGKPLDLYNHPQNLFVAGFIGSPRMNLIETVVEQTETGTVLRSSADAVEISSIPGVSAGDHVTFGIRPEHLEIAENGELHAVVESAEQLGGETYLYCRTAGGSDLTVHQIGQLAITAGQDLTLNLDRSKLHLFDANGATIANGVTNG